MDKNEISEKLNSIADGIEKIAQSLEESEYQTEKTAASSAQEFGFGEVGSQPSKGLNPLMDFCLS